ncbi:MAG: hypothetical protein Kow0079_15100 [Vicingaceae bacterium]
MKKLIYFPFSLLLFFILTAAVQQTTDECSSTLLKKQAKELLNPDYKYDSSKTMKITTKSKKQVKELEIPLYIGEKYKFIFNTACMPKGVDVKVYSKKIGNKKRKLLYNLSDQLTEGQNIYTWEPEKSRKMYIDFEIPASDQTETGTVIFLLGYKF